MSLSSISDKVSQINGLERKYTSIIKNPLNLLSPTKFGPFSQSVLTKMKGRGDPVLAMDWSIDLPIIAKKSLSFEYVERASLVFPRFETREVYQQGVMVKYPGATREIDDLVLTLYADINNTSFEYVNMWLNLVGKRGEYGRPSVHGTSYIGYKHPINIYIKDMYQEDLIKLTYIGCWPTGLNSVDLIGDSSDRITWEATFAVEDVEISGYNLQTITGSIMNLVSGTISSVMGAAKDAVASIGNAAFDAVKGPISNGLSSASNFIKDKASGIFGSSAPSPTDRLSV